MKNKRIIAVVSIVLLIALLAWYLSGSKSENHHSPLQPTVSGDQQAIKIEAKQKTDIKKLIDLAKEAPEKLKELMMSNPKMAAMDAMGKAMNASFHFYGRIVDQHGDIVSNVEVVYSMGGFGSFGQPFSHVSSMQSDANGRVHISGNSSSYSFRSLKKEGYEFARVPSYFTYAHTEGMTLKYKGSPEKPVILHAWKKVESEPLIFVRRVKYRYLFNSTPNTVDLLEARSRTGRSKGDIVVSFWRDPNSSRGDAGDWNISLEAIGGGLLEATNIFMNQAPEEGYQNKILISHKRNEKGYVSRADKKYYLKSRNGQVYARLEVQIRPYYNDRESVIILKYWVNPSGSRNLQYDRKKQIAPK